MSERAAIRQVRMRWDGTVTDSLTLHCTRARLFPSVYGYAPHLAGQWRDTPPRTGDRLPCRSGTSSSPSGCRRAEAAAGSGSRGRDSRRRKQGCGLRRKGQKEQGQHQQSTHIVSFPGGIPGYTGSFYQKRPEEYRNPSQEGAVGRSGRGASRAYPPQTAQRHNTMLRAMFSAAKDASPER